jgi:PPOX class probable F420-dependent enzyme
LSRRDQIVLTSEEAAAFLAEQRIVTCATFGPRGWPHLMPLWYVVRDGTLWAWTYAKSQKTRNLERDPRCTLQIEAGGDVYSELRGIMIEAEAVIHRDLETVAGVGAELGERYGGAQVTPEILEAMRRQAAKRVAIEFRERRRSTWDHRKLGGTY